MKYMSELLDLGADIASATPERCAGCWEPPRLAEELAEDVQAGTMSTDQAKQALANCLDDLCHQGRVVIPQAIGTLISCSYRPD